jgi:predicted RNA binding protein YcfA (HicA-like mRNA interferase family)
MPQLPLLSAQKIVKTFEKFGYRVARQKGSHMRLTCEGRPSITVPNYKAIDRSLLIKILRDARISPEEFLSKM